MNFSLVFAFDLPVVMFSDCFTCNWGNSWILPSFVSCIPPALSGQTFFFSTELLFCFSLGSVLNIFHVCHPSFGCGFSRLFLVSSSHSSFLDGLLGNFFPDFFYVQSCLYLLYLKDGWLDNKILGSRIFLYILVTVTFFLGTEYCYGKSGARILVLVWPPKEPLSFKCVTYTRILS